MKIRAQIGMVLNLDKCIGCHTCSVTCKNVWTSRPGMEYAWFNNVETKPGIGYPKDWENQERWNGGWVRKRNGKIEPKIGGKWRVLAKIFANPDLPEMGFVGFNSSFCTVLCADLAANWLVPFLVLETGRDLSRLQRTGDPARDGHLTLLDAVSWVHASIGLLQSPATLWRDAEP